MREIVLDTETTGLNPLNGDRVIEIGCVELSNHLPTGNTYHQYINPERDMPSSAFEVHGLSADFLKSYPIFDNYGQKSNPNRLRSVPLPAPKDRPNGHDENLANHSDILRSVPSHAPRESTSCSAPAGRRCRLTAAAAVTAATITAHSGLRNAVGVVIDHKGADASSKQIWAALSPKAPGISGSLHKTMLKPATAAGRALAQAAEGAKCYMFKRGRCPPMIDPNTVLMLGASGLLCVAYTISYVNGMVGSSLNYQRFNNGRKCKGWQCDVNLHHATTLRKLFGLCFVPNKINKLICFPFIGASCCHSPCPLLWTPSRAARACRASRSWTATAW